MEPLTGCEGCGVCCTAEPSSTHTRLTSPCGCNGAHMQLQGLQASGDVCSRMCSRVFQNECTQRCVLFTHVPAAHVGPGHPQSAHSRLPRSLTRSITHAG
jgi:hypothetical protein